MTDKPLYFWTERVIQCSDGNMLIERTPVGDVPPDFAKYVVKVFSDFVRNTPQGRILDRRSKVAILPGATIEDVAANMRQVIEDTENMIGVEYHAERTQAQLAAPLALSHQQRRKLVKA